MSSNPLLFVGDPHGEFDSIIRDTLEVYPLPGTLVIVGDLELFGPAKVALAPLLKAGWYVRFILGNHDAISHQQYGWLMSPRFGLPDSFLGGKVLDVNGLKVAGLSGVFKGRIWDPKQGPPRFQSRAEWSKRYPGRLWRGGLPPDVIDAIFPEDFEALREQRCHVLVCHEGPSSVHRGMGFEVIDALAEEMGAMMIVHGHHHFDGVSILPNGIVVRSLGRQKVWKLPQP